MVWGYSKSGIPAACGKTGGNQSYAGATFVEAPASLGRLNGPTTEMRDASLRIRRLRWSSAARMTW